MQDELKATKTKKQSQSEIDEKNAQLKKDHNFYSVKIKAGKFQGMSIKKAKIIDKLRDNHFYRYDVDTDNIHFIEIKKNLIKEVSTVQITDQFFEFVNKLDDNKIKTEETDDNGNSLDTEIIINKEMIRTTLIEKITEYFSKAVLFRLVPDGPIEIKKDTRHEKFLYFTNGFISITKNGFELYPYDKLDKKIWENQRLNREYKPNYGKGDFEQFIERICGHKINGAVTESVKERIKCLKTITGYALHGFFDYKLKSIIFTDSKISDDDEPNGRTGKTLYCKGIGKMLNYDDKSRVFVEINGKDFLANKDFKYQYCSMETQLIHLNDLDRNTKFEMFSNDITEGITVNIKNEKPFRIFTKMILSTNRTFRIDGETNKDRAIQFEFSDYYSTARSPYLETGRWFFTEWDDQQWNMFDTFMISCIQDFLKYDLLEPASINLHRRTLIDHTCHEFVDFFDDFFNNKSIKFNDGMFAQTLTIEWGERMNKSHLYLAFTQAYPNDFSPSKFKQRTFTNWLRQYSRHCEFLQPISKESNREGRANSIDWIIFDKK